MAPPGSRAAAPASASASASALDLEPSSCRSVTGKLDKRDLAPGISTGPEAASICNGAEDEGLVFKEDRGEKKTYIRIIEKNKRETHPLALFF